MKVFILCGGSGSRMQDYSFPKPLNMIYGKPAIAYTIEKLPSSVTEIHFIVAPHLQRFNFKEIVVNAFPAKKCVFHELAYFTRGALESAFLGTNDISVSDEPIVFLDNDVMYSFPDGFFDDKSTHFLGYAEDSTGTESFSFLTLDSNNNVIDYKEKVRISSKFCCGVYGFKSLSSFREIAEIIVKKPFSKELYMSSAFTYMIDNMIPIKGIEFTDTMHIGSLSELEKGTGKLHIRKMRVCFDLDNTLVTYPTIAKDYSSVKPIHRMIDLARKLHSDGHTIIIYTARRMGTHNGNVGAAIKDIGAQTFKTLEEFQIPYDELIFGKPIADMYIDDRALNPFRDDMRCMGLIDYTETVAPVNMLATNKYNSIHVQDNLVSKTGPSEFIDGELFFYRNIPTESDISNYFPRLVGFKQGDSGTTNIRMEHISGVPLYTLFKNKLITKDHIRALFEFTDVLHNYVGETLPTPEDVSKNYESKLVQRFEIAENYPFEDATLIQTKCLDRLKKYKTYNIRHFIHGDLWFSNIILDFKNNFKFIDMKGQVNGKFSTGGDAMYDYGKLYQSILGYDLVLYNDSCDPVYLCAMKSLFEEEIKKRNIPLEDLKTVTFSLVIGTLHSIKDLDAKTRVWNWIKENF